MKKLILSFLAIMTLCSVSMAQSKTMVLYKGGVKMYEQHISNVDSVVFKTTPDTVKDIDGNVYRTITYIVKGKPVTWMIDNLKTTKLNDGTPIYNVINENAEYADGLTPATGTTAPLRTTPAYCWHMNQLYNKDIFGGLYNHYAIETEKLAPKGWHVATNQEWMDLENTLATVDANNNDGVAVFDGTALKVAKSMASQFTWSSTSNWKQIGNNPNANNNSGFSLVACGYRAGISWGSSMNNGFYWTATVTSTGTAEKSGGAISRNIVTATEGFPNTTSGQLKVNNSTLMFGVRCVKDAAP
jgi:uncharacterized protein (TIGR02145 family)